MIYFVKVFIDVHLVNDINYTFIKRMSSYRVGLWKRQCGEQRSPQRFRGVDLDPNNFKPTESMVEACLNDFGRSNNFGRGNATYEEIVLL